MLAAKPPARPQPAAKRVLASRAQRALSDLAAGGGAEQTPKLVQEILDLDAWVSSLVDFVPLLGPWRLYRRGILTSRATERRFAQSIVVSLLAVVMVAFVVPSQSAEVADLEHRLKTEIQVVTSMLEKYRSEHGGYPDVDLWRRLWVEAPQVFDPWGRMYHYALDDQGGPIVTTFGRDGVPGGTNEDKDLSVHLPPAAS